MKKLFLGIVFISSLVYSQKKSILPQEIDNITKGKNATVAVSVSGIDFPFNYHNQNADKKLPMLSVFKFHIACTILDLVDQGKLSLQQKYLIKKADLHPVTWSPLREKYPDGNIELSLQELLHYTVSESDNNTCDYILRLIGDPKTVQNFIKKKELKNTQILRTEEDMHTDNYKILYDNYTTTKSLSDLLKQFYYGKIISKKSTDLLIQMLLETSTGANKLVTQLPKGTPVAHKTGSSGKVGNLTIAENDSGIITLPNGKHYTIVVFVNDSTESEEVNCKMVADISKTVWDHLK